MVHMKDRSETWKHKKFFEKTFCEKVTLNIVSMVVHRKDKKKKNLKFSKSFYH